MEFKIEKKEFFKMLSIASSFAGKSKALPITDNVRFTIKGNRYKLESCDGTNGIRVYGNLTDGSGDVQFLVEPSALSSYMKLVSDEYVSVSVMIDEKRMVLSHKSGLSEFPIMESSQFPESFSGEEKSVCQIESSVLKDFIESGMAFASNDELRPIMCGIYIYNKDGEFGYCSTDTHCLSHKKFSSENTEDYSFIVPNYAFRGVKDVLSSCDSVSISRIGDGKIKIGGSGYAVCYVEPNGNYPNFKAVIPSERKIVTSARKEDILEAVMRAKVSIPASRLVIFDISENHILVSACDNDFSRKTEERVECKSNGSIRIGFNLDKIVKCVSCVESEEINICTINETRPALVFGSGDDESCVVLVMPMMIN